MLETPKAPTEQDFDTVYLRLLQLGADIVPVPVFDDNRIGGVDCYLSATAEPPTISYVTVGRGQSHAFRAYKHIASQEVGVQHCIWRRTRANTCAIGRVPVALSIDAVQELSDRAAAFAFQTIAGLAKVASRPAPLDPQGGHTA